MNGSDIKISRYHSLGELDEIYLLDTLGQFKKENHDLFINIILEELRKKPLFK